MTFNSPAQEQKNQPASLLLASSQTDLASTLATFEAETLLKLRDQVVADRLVFSAKHIDGVQALADELVIRNLSSLEQVNQLLGNTVKHIITVAEDNSFMELKEARVQSAKQITQAYSLMKFGSAQHITSFGNTMANHYIEALKDPNSAPRKIFDAAKSNGEFVVFISPGSRNVESSQNFVFKVAIDRINNWLALQDLPTIIFVNLARFGSNPANYAKLPKADRESRPKTTSTILPSSDFYVPGVHVIFGDDVRITGATADRVRRSALENAALSVQSLYLFQLDPAVTKTTPGVENVLNTQVITGELDSNVEFILQQADFRPVQRLVRIVLGADNRDNLQGFLTTKVPDQSLVKLYIAALGNDYAKDPKYQDSVGILRQVMIDKELTDGQGMLII